MTKSDLLARMDAVLAQGQKTIDSVPPPSGGVLANLASSQVDADSRWVSGSEASRFRTAGLALLLHLYGREHQSYIDFLHLTTNANVVGRHKKAHALLLAVRDEIEHGWLVQLRSLVSADIFANFLEMSDYLLSEGYKDSAAVLVGGALEGHLKSLATGRGIDITVTDAAGGQRPKKAEALNQDLHKAGVYLLGDQKQITAWLHLRNHAAHGDYGKYDATQVRHFLDGVRAFTLRVPS